jgi:hypothetical protein
LIHGIEGHAKWSLLLFAVLAAYFFAVGSFMFYLFALPKVVDTFMGAVEWGKGMAQINWVALCNLAWAVRTRSKIVHYYS